MPDPSASFAVKDCDLLAIATGRKAQNLREFRDVLQTVHLGSIYHHFWGGRLRPQFDDPEFNNDFAAWAMHGLHDARLAEQLAMIDPTQFPDLEALRAEVLDVVEARLDQSEHVLWARADQEFPFIRSQVVVFDTKRVIRAPEELAEQVPHLSLGSVFYHFIEARRRREDRADDFRGWLAGLGEEHSGLCGLLAGVDYYFEPLSALRARLAALFRDHFGRKEPR